MFIPATMIRQLVSQANESEYEKGLMPLLKKGAKSLYKRFSDAAHDAISVLSVLSV